MPTRLDESLEWLEPDGLGGFAMGTATGVRTRRYHSLLTVADHPPSDRVHLVKGFDAWVESPEGRFAISSQRYPGVDAHPDGASHLSAFEHHPWPRWTYRLPTGLVIEQELVVLPERETVLLRWRAPGAGASVRLIVRPFLAASGLHTTQHRNPDAHTDPTWLGPATLSWQLYMGSTPVAAGSNGRYRHDPAWYENFLYTEEAERGLDCTEDLASPGEFEFSLDDGAEAVLVFRARKPATDPDADAHAVAQFVAAEWDAEARRRARAESPLHLSADAYIVRRGEGKTIVAGYPWFEDWGRDTFIAMRGLCLATGRLREAGDMLTQWASAVSEGMLPNRFVDAGGAPEFNSVDASLWYVVAAGEFLTAVNGKRKRYREIEATIQAILEGYSRGTRYNIHADSDGLLAAGQPGVQLTWMDAKVGDWVVTPRIGKPVEVQALWINALAAGAAVSPEWERLQRLATASFAKRFWNAECRCLFDVIDVDHQHGRNDDSIRPNQLFAVGGLPLPILAGDQAASVVDRVSRDLLTPAGLRSLAPGSAGYRRRYEGAPLDRDGAYHQGTVWPWLLGPFVEAWLRVRAQTPEHAAEARRRFVGPWRDRLTEGGLGHISEILDADPPRRSRGCPFQAWSLSELLRIEALLRRIERADARPADPTPGRHAHEQATLHAPRAHAALPAPA